MSGMEKIINKENQFQLIYFVLLVEKKVVSS